MTRPRLTERILAARVQRTMQGRERKRRTVTRRDGVRCEVEGRWLVNFAGNDYLGLAQQYGGVDALQSSAARDGVGAVSGRGAAGHNVDALHQPVGDRLQVVDGDVAASVDENERARCTEAAKVRR